MRIWQPKKPKSLLKSIIKTAGEVLLPDTFGCGDHTKKLASPLAIPQPLRFAGGRRRCCCDGEGSGNGEPDTACPFCLEGTVPETVSITFSGFNDGSCICSVFNNEYEFTASLGHSPCFCEVSEQFTINCSGVNYPVRIGLQLICHDGANPNDFPVTMLVRIAGGPMPYLLARFEKPLYNLSTCIWDDVSLPLTESSRLDTVCGVTEDPTCLVSSTL